ncbi:primosomal protein N' [Thermohalobacter berrensis]|uniref:Replication restart protein PriA n=1 Tax=Thermohalobacter berrensis TaxID=99594 RepID=A0A419TA56_9FIRM|nr:primosomal protein N' [Thermohalobacter berrensis]RKD34360.1 primosomal protein N' [Thermohalobacter berrensis]
MNKRLFADVIVDNKSTKTDRPFSYLIPDEHKFTIKRGMRVLVPFGFGNKLVEGIVVNVKNSSDVDISKVKSIEEIIGNKPILTEEMLKLGIWMKNKYLAQYIDVFKTIMPTGISKKLKQYVSLNNGISFEEIKNIKSENQKKILKYLYDNGESSVDILKNKLKIKNISSSIKALEKKNLITIRSILASEVKKKYKKFVFRNFNTFNIQKVLQNINKRAFKQLEIIKFMCNNESVALNDLMIKTESSLSSVKSLENKGYIKIVEKEIKRNPINKKIPRTKKLELTEEQKNCVDTIYKDISEGKNNTFLIHGVTGSGKTEVYLQLIEKMLQKEKQSIVLVPEISLTPQTVERFVGRFGDKVAVLHSKLSLGERYDEWRKIREGKVKIVVGARSAIFAPFDNLGLIIIDEEHETSYKSSMSPKYDAIEVAQKRCELENATLILGSATPSIETYYKAQQGEIKLLTLSKRINNRKMPPIEIIDMKEELDNGNKSIFSKSLYEAIKENLQNKKQTILFLNRRGFSTFISCRKCGYVAKCNKCDISLTYHLSENILKCHYCGLAKKPPTICPECKSKYIKYFGVGTQKVEEIVKRTFPKARVARMDVDTTIRKGSHQKILDKVKNGDVDILIGTQMISKGLDFPNVTLVGIIAADITLNLPDFKSAERTFQLITQVGGRAGRGETEGRVILQTYEPEHYSIKTAKEHDYINFYNKEIAIRKEFDYPPFVDIINIIMADTDEKKLYNTCYKTIDILKEKIGYEKIKNGNIKILGPHPAPISKIKGYHRWQVLIKCKGNHLAFLKKIIKKVFINTTYENIKVSIDINPNSIL